MKFTHFKGLILSIFLLFSFGVTNIHAEDDCGKFFPSIIDIDITKVFFEASGGLAFPLFFSSQDYVPMTSYGGNISAGVGINLGGWMFSLDYSRSMYGQGTNSGALMENFINNILGLRVRRVLSKASISKLPAWLEIVPGFEVGYNFITTDYYTSVRAKEDGRLTSIGLGEPGAGCFFTKVTYENSFNIGTDLFVPYLEGDFNIFRDTSIGGGFGMFFTINLGFRTYPFGRHSKPIKVKEVETLEEIEEEIPQIDLSAPVEITLQSSIHDNFTPDGDGVNDKAVLNLGVSNNQEDAAAWKVEILDPKGGIFRTYSASGMPPASIEWDGLSDSGEEVFSMNTYGVRFTLTPSATDIARTGQDSIIAEDSIRTGIQMQVIIPNKKWKIIVNTIHFDPDKATFNKISESQRMENQQTLDSLVEQIQAHPDCLITIEGYANNVSNTERENIEELLPLSKLRAEAILQMLCDRGISADILSAEGKGGANPLAAWEDTASWWKNRRVEFIVQKKE